MNVGPVSGRRGNRQASADNADPLAHPEQAQAPTMRSARLRRRHVEADPIVTNRQAEFALAV
jgi:hypothetical protein